MGGGGRGVGRGVEGGWEGVEGGLGGGGRGVGGGGRGVTENEGAHSRPPRHPRFFIHLKKKSLN